jgi:DNA-binding CsgD family transcriptional regulator
VRASLGFETEARENADRALELAGEHSAAVARIHSVWALGLLELSLDRPAEAVEVLSRERARLLSAGVGEPGAVRFVSDEIEALVALGRLEDAVALVRWLEERGRALNRASALAAAGRCSGLLAAARGEIDIALRSFEGALAAHERVQMPFEHARTLLVFGSVQRRARKRSAARETLDRALSAFEQLGATLWAERAQAELGRIAGRAPAGWGLTATEYRVAELVAAGLTNREAAARLFLTQKTVEFHLRNVYRKLGVRSRTELARSPDLKH